MADEARTFSRFVRPIYDAIDGKQYKVAIKLAQNKKIASLDIVQVLKAHCLERTGKVDEALAICRTVQSHRPTDETLLNTMALVFRLCGCEHEMLPTYEWACAATAAQPNEELLVSLFVAYARRGDFLKQQQTALKLFKAFGNIKYVCWAALSMVLQVQHAGASSKMLALADKMLLKTMRDTESDDGEALQLLVHILQLQDKHTEALQVFDEFAPRMVDGIANKKKKAEEEEDHCHDHGCSHSHAPKATGRAAEGEGAYDDEIELGPLQAIDRLTLEAALTKRVAEFQRSGNVYHELVNKYNADDWTYLTELIDTRVSANDGDVAQVEKELLGEFDALATKEGNTHLRGPWLARVHLQSEKLKRLPAGVGKDTKAAEEAAFVAAILAYTDRFYSKTCCFSDLKQYFALCDDAAVISAHTKTSLVAKFEEIGTKAIAGSSAVHDETTRKEALNQLHRRLLSLKTLRFLGAYKTASVADLETLVTSLVNEYELNAWLNLGATGGQREVQNTDDLLLLAAHTLIDIYQRNPSTSRQRLIDTAVLLEYGLEKSGYNFQMKLLLSRVYAYLGASEAMMQRHKQLDVKHIQLDSLTFLVFDKLLQLCYHTEARRVCDSVRRLHNSTANDTPEYIARSYRLGVYSKVLDMTSFLREKMQNSHTLAIARGEALQFELQDALTGGPSKLNELVTSARFTKAVDDLEKMLQPPVVLSQNQHREVVVQWDSQPLVASSDSFGQEGSALTECDRSATFTSSLQWIKLQLVVPKILMKVLDSTNTDAEAITALATEYDEIVKSLGVANAGVKAKVWSWSVDVVRVAADIAASESASNADELAARVSALVNPLTGVRDSIIGSLPSQSPLSSSSLSNVAALIRDAGLWSGALLCGVSRVVAKKKGSSGKKTDDPVASSLRVLIKTVQDTLAAVEAHVKALQVASDVGGKSIVTVSGSSSGDIDAARSKVEGNIAQSYEATQRMVSELLKNASASMRQFHQK